MPSFFITSVFIRWNGLSRSRPMRTMHPRSYWGTNEMYPGLRWGPMRWGTKKKGANDNYVTRVTLGGGGGGGGGARRWGTKDNCVLGVMGGLWDGGTTENCVPRVIVREPMIWGLMRNVLAGLRLGTNEMWGGGGGQWKLYNQGYVGGGGCNEMGDQWELCTRGYIGEQCDGVNDKCVTRVTFGDQWEQGR